jgi:hypothetical protein
MQTNSSSLQSVMQAKQALVAEKQVLLQQQALLLQEQMRAGLPLPVRQSVVNAYAAHMVVCLATNVKLSALSGILEAAGAAENFASNTLLCRPITGWWI